MFKFLIIFLVLISMLITYVAGVGVFVIPSVSTSCKNYVHAQYTWASFPLCYVQRTKVPINDPTVSYNCAYWQAYTLLSLNNASSLQALFPNLNLTGISSDNVGLDYFTYQNSLGVTTQTSAWIGTALGEVNSVERSSNLIQTEVIVFNSTIGHVRIQCPMGTLNNATQILCSLPNNIFICTYNQNASNSDIQSLITGAISVDVNVQSIGIVNQTNCPQTIYQNPPITL